MIEMVRHSFLHDGLTLSYLDTSGDRPAVVALHGHMMEALTFAPLADALAPDWRVIALDQRGHGHSDHAETYTRDDYLGDTAALYRHLGLDIAVLLGNSLGGVNAYQFAARHPKSVRALVIEDIGAIVADDIGFVLPWGGTFPTRDALEERIGPLFASYFVTSYRQNFDGWKLAFDPRDMVASQVQLNGDHWDDWLTSKCSALLIRGRDSKITTATQFDEMAAQRPLTTMVTLNGGHVLHADDPAGFVQAVRTFVTCL